MNEYIDPKELLQFIESKLQDRERRMEAINDAKVLTGTVDYTYMEGEVNQLLAIKRWMEENTIKIR